MPTHLPRLRVHIGAHKTASTHFQEMLSLQKDAMLREGVQYIDQDYARRTGLINVMRGSGIYRWQSPAKRLGLFHKLVGGTTAHCIAISDENLIGSSQDVLQPVFYEKTEHRLRSLRDMFADHDLEICLAIRHQARFLPSIYVQSLRSRPLKETFDEMKARLVQRPPRWADFVERLVKVLPDRPVTIWTFERYIADPMPCMEAFLGLDRITNLGLDAPSRTKSPSAETVQLVEQLSPLLPTPLYRARARKIIENDLGKTKFNPFSNQETAVLDGVYENDKARIRDMNVTFMDVVSFAAPL